MTSADDRLVNVLGALALGLTDAMQAAIEEVSALTGAAPAALVVLDDLLAGGSIDRLRRAVAVTPSGGVRIVDRLADAGLVRREPGVDGRSVAVELTAAGHALASRVRDARAAAVQAALGGLSGAQRSRLTPLVDTMITALVEQRLAERAAGEQPAGGYLCRLCDPAACGRADGHCPAMDAASD